MRAARSWWWSLWCVDGGGSWPIALCSATPNRYLALDLELYHFASRIFDARIARMRHDRARGVVCRLEAPLAAPGCTTICHREE